MYDRIFRKIYGSSITTKDKNVTLKHVVVLKLMLDPQELRTTNCN